MNKPALNLYPSDYSDLLHNKLIYKYALENSNIGVWDWDIINNRVYHSKESKLIYGYEESEIDLSEVDWRDRIHPDDLKKLQKLIDKNINGKTKEYRSEHRVLCKDGSYKWVLDCGKIIAYDALGNPSRFIGTTTDITNQKEDKESITQSLNIISNQNKKLTNFAHIVTHNLKEYAGNFESLLHFYDEADTNREKLELIDHLKTVSTSLANTIKNLNEIVSKQHIKKIEREHLNIHQYIENTIKILDLDIVKKQAIIKNNVDRNLFIYANSSYLESIIQNLASNALKYSHPERQPIIIINSQINEEGVLTIKVADNGIGINLNEFGNDVFGLYRTFHGNENAEGVGLYLVKSQVETLGGTIDIESEVDKGTVFTISMNTKKTSQ